MPMDGTCGMRWDVPSYATSYCASSSPIARHLADVHEVPIPGLDGVVPGAPVVVLRGTHGLRLVPRRLHLWRKNTWLLGLTGGTGAW